MPTVGVSMVPRCNSVLVGSWLYPCF